MKKLIYFGFFLLTMWSYGQKKTILAQSTPQNIIIDGKLDEAAWQNAPIATDFVMLDPDNGKAIPQEKEQKSKYSIITMPFTLAL